MTALTGKLYKTSIGNIIGYNEQETPVNVGDSVSFDGIEYIVKKVVISSTPPLRKSIEVERIRVE